MVRYGLLAALLFAANTFGATVQGDQCADGTRKVAGDCAAVLTANNASNIETTSATCNYNLDRADGDTAVCVAPTATTLVDHADVVACNGTNEAGDSEAVAAAGNRAVAVTGLTNAIGQRCWFSHVNPSTWESNLAVSAEFTPPNPPAEGDNAARIEAILNGREPHFAYSTPADPVTTRQVTVTSASQFNSEAATNGTEITINSSFSGNVTITGNDIDVIMSNGATITGNLQLGSFSFRSTRVRWTGGNISGRLLGNNFQDYLFDDFYLDSGSGFNDLTAANQRFDRLAFINTTIRNTPSGGGNDWALFVLQRPTDQHRGIIFANFKIMSNGGLHAWRLQSVNDIMIVDSVGNPDGLATSGLRIHLNSTDVWIKDSWVRGNFHINEVSGSDGYPQVVNALFDNLDRYEGIGTYAFFAPVTVNNSGEIRNSRHSSTAGAGSGTISAGGGITVGSGNDRVAWNGSTVPDYSNVGAIR